MMRHPAWKLALSWPDGGHQVEPGAFLDHPRLEMEGRFAFPDNLRRTFRGRFLVTLAPGISLPGTLIEAAARKTLPIMGILLARLAHDAPWREIHRGRLHELRRNKGVWELEFSIAYPNAQAPMCRRLYQVTNDPVDDRWLPQVFGTMWVHGVPLFDVDRAQLGDVLDASETEVLLLRPVNWPTQGIVQIQDEIVGYTWDPQLPDRLQLDTRNAPREHPRGAAVFRLSMVPVQWCVADHEAAVELLRMDDVETGPVIDGTILVEPTAGRDWTLVSRDALPLRVLHGRDAVEVFLRDGQTGWSLTGENSAIGANNAFPAPVMGSGALLQYGSDVLEAVYTRDQSLGTRRHDRVERLFLEFYFTESAFWEDGGELQVLVGKGSRLAIVNIGQGFRIDEVPAAGNAQIPDKQDALYIRWHRGMPTPVVADGAWSAVSSIIDGTHRPGFAVNQGAECALSCGIEGDETLPEEASALRLTARVTNRDDTAPVDVRLRIKVDGVVADEYTSTLPSDGQEILSLDIHPSTAIPHGVYTNPDTEFSVVLPDGGDVLVESPHLEVLGAARAAPVGVTEPLAVTASAMAPIVSFRGRLEITHLLEAEEGMAFLGPEGGAPWIRFVLAGVTSGSPWTLRLRDVQWVAQLRPATSVMPATSIHALVEGRAADNGGHANPADVIGEILVDPLMGNQTTEAIDSSSFEDAGHVLHGRSTAFGAVIAGSDTVGDALETALAEALLSLHWFEGCWKLRVHTADPAESNGEMIDETDVYQPGFNTRVALPNQPLGRQRLRRRDDMEIGPVTVDGVPPLPSLRWLMEGAEFLAHALEARAVATSHVEEAAISIDLLFPGENPVALLPRSPVLPWKILGEPTRVALRDGVTIRACGAVRPYRVMETGGVPFGRWLLDGGVVFLLEGGNPATINARGYMYIRGDGGVAAGNPPPGVTPDGNGGLFLRAPDDGAWFHLMADGELQSSHGVTENAEIAVPMEAPGFVLGGAHLALGGVAGAPALLLLDGEGIRLAGSLVSR